MWQETKEILTDRLPANAFSLWIEPLTCTRSDDAIMELAGPDRFFCSWVAENYLEMIQDCLASVGKEKVQVRFTVTAQSNKQKPGTEQLRLPSMPKAKSFCRTLHPRFTFNEFMVGESNILPQSACEALANNDQSLGPCLYIEAETGLGKSHLAHAVAHHVLNNFPATRLHYLNAQQLTAEMVHCIKSNTMDLFKEKYHHQCDVLLMEDIHTLTGKTKTQEELSAVLDVLIETGKRVIFTGKKSPKDIPNIDEGFRSRLSLGLLTTIKPPDMQTRLRIITRKAMVCGLRLDEDVVNYLAENLRGDVRQVESTIVGLKAKASLLQQDPDITMAKELLANLIGKSQELTTEVIRNFIARQFKTSVNDLKSKSRKKVISFPRQVAMYLSRKYTEQGLADIGNAFNRDHSTVVHAVRVISEGMIRNETVRGQIELLSDKIKQQYL